MLDYIPPNLSQSRATTCHSSSDPSQAPSTKLNGPRVSLLMCILVQTAGRIDASAVWQGMNVVERATLHLAAWTVKGTRLVSLYLIWDTHGSMFGRSLGVVPVRLRFKVYFAPCASPRARRRGPVAVGRRTTDLAPRRPMRRQERSVARNDPSSPGVEEIGRAKLLVLLSEIPFARRHRQHRQNPCALQR